jgi:nucleoside-diphosphate-sugar epimerase
MPTVNKGTKVLVTGANGYMAMWINRNLLERGFTVRGTVRTEDKGKFMKDYFKSLGYGDDKFEVIVVDDIVKVGNRCFRPFF